jgi:hypothetical protein
MRILITGDRHWRCNDLAERIVNRLIKRYGADITIIHGGAMGVDNAFSEACRKLGVTFKAHLADWKGLGNIAGPERNREMVATKPDFVIAFHRDLARSKGTKDCVKQALAAGLDVYLFDHETRNARRIKADDPRLAWIS